MFFLVARPLALHAPSQRRDRSELRDSWNCAPARPRSPSRTPDLRDANPASGFRTFGNLAISRDIRPNLPDEYYTDRSNEP